MKLEMLTGDEALAHIGSAEFEAKWRTLYAHCPWATGCQHPGFVTPWYTLYRQRYLPVVLFALADDGSLEGLLTLALSRDGRRMTGAGGGQAEYQGWLAGAQASDGFAPGAIGEVRAAFPHALISLKYLPPGIPLEWFRTGADARAWCTLRSHARPIMKTGVEAMERQRRKKNHRQNYNRLNRLGNVAFERVTGDAHFARIFDDICMQYDFRQAALYRDMPFSNDPLKKRFYLALHKGGMLHTTVLTVEDEIVASHVGLLTKENAVHLGINTHAPAFAAHSPGNLLLALLGVQLAHEQVGILDLTPGGDRYKEQFASEHDLAYELDIFGDPLQKLVAQVLAGARRSSKAVLRKAGWRAVDVLEVAEKIRGSWRVEPQRLLEKIRSRAGEPVLWEHSAPAGPMPQAVDTLPVSTNSLDDVFKYDDAGASVTHGAFIGTVMKRLERAEQLYSCVLQDKLAIHCWACTGPDGAVILYDLYVHPHLGNDGLVRRFLGQVLSRLGRTIPAPRIAYRGPLAPGLHAAFRHCGFSVPATQPKETR
jgi:CelD/BcsL family acetyltransferase involved in cellulose biosynthesis